jgi:hypothetical protein
MPLQEETAFVHDRSPNMTTEEKNMSLSATLAVAPYVNMNIVRIVRSEEPPGWWIHQRTGSPSEEDV